jgi:hypothetical protein
MVIFNHEVQKGSSWCPLWKNPCAHCGKKATLNF